MQIIVGVSSCLIGNKVNFQGEALTVKSIVNLCTEYKLELFAYCPEDVMLGSPINNLRIVGGNGDDVWSDKATVIDEDGLNITMPCKQGATLFLEFLQANKVEIVILTDGSPSCGSTLLLNEDQWPKGGLVGGFGVTTSLLRQNKIKVFSHLQLDHIHTYLQSVNTANEI